MHGYNDIPTYLSLRSLRMSGMNVHIVRSAEINISRTIVSTRGSSLE